MAVLQGFSLLLEGLNRVTPSPLFSLFWLLISSFVALIVLLTIVLLILTLFPRGCFPVSHLSGADEIILFTLGHSRSFKHLMAFLKNYELSSGQKINFSKSSFFNPKCCLPQRIGIIQNVTGFRKQNFPFTYLGCPIYSGKKTISLF